MINNYSANFCKLLLTTICVVLVAGCAKKLEPNRYVQTTRFNLASYQKFTQANAPLNIYIEGDGRASVFKLTDDPTPQSTTVLELAALDPAANVAYLARPCQFSPKDLISVCEKKYWSTARYGADVVEAMNSAISQLKHQAQASEINLIGYSGGGAIAVIVASMRNDIASIRTIAGNLDLKAMDQHHRTAPLTESLDPLDFASSIKNIPQLHFVGKDDNVVPAVVAENFRQHAGLTQKQIIILPGVSHAKGWTKRWPALINYQP